MNALLEINNKDGHLLIRNDNTPMSISKKGIFYGRDFSVDVQDMEMPMAFFRSNGSPVWSRMHLDNGRMNAKFSTLDDNSLGVEYYIFSKDPKPQGKCGLQMFNNGVCTFDSSWDFLIPIGHYQASEPGFSLDIPHSGKVAICVTSPREVGTVESYSQLISDYNISTKQWSSYYVYNCTDMWGMEHIAMEGNRLISKFQLTVQRTYQNWAPISARPGSGADFTCFSIDVSHISI